VLFLPGTSIDDSLRGSAIRFCRCVRSRVGRLKTQDYRGEPQRASERQESVEREKHMAAFGLGKAASIHPSCHRRDLRLTHMTSLAQTPEHETDGAGQLLVVIGGTATKQSVDGDYYVIKSERPMTPHASAASWVLASSAAKARYRLAVAYRG
jgi:hypothetical protein